MRQFPEDGPGAYPARYMFVSEDQVLQYHEVVEHEDLKLMVRNYFMAVADAWERKEFGPTKERTILVRLVEI